MQVLILYYSKSGNTKLLAQAISEGVTQVEGVSAVMKNTAEVTKDDFLNCQGIIAGSPVYFGTMAYDLKRVFDEFVGTRKKMEGKIGAAFATGGDATGGKETTIFSIIQAMLIYGMVITGDPMEATGHYGVACLGKPDDTAVKNARLLGKRVAMLAKKLMT